MKGTSFKTDWNVECLISQMQANKEEKSKREKKVSNVQDLHNTCENCTLNDDNWNDNNMS